MLLERFQSGKNLTLPVIYALLRPFGLCYEFLTVHTINKYFTPIVVSIANIIVANFVFEADLSFLYLFNVWKIVYCKPYSWGKRIITELGIKLFLLVKFTILTVLKIDLFIVLTNRIDGSRSKYYLAPVIALAIFFIWK